MRTCCCTSFTYAYLARARILLQTLREAQPGWDVVAVVVDEPPPGLDPAAALAGFDRAMGLDDLGVHRVRSWLFKHALVEACTAVKAAAMRRLMDDGYGQVLFLDPDTAVFNPLAPVLDAAGDASILLTPHQTEPNWQPLAVQENEMASLRYGVFNLGFLAVRATPTGRAFLDWWAKQLHADCRDAPEEGLFTDQKYADLVPCLFPGVAILRDPGCNVASWNLSTRRMRIGRDGRITVNGAPLRLCHFTKVGGVGDTMMERYAGNSLAPREIWAWYHRELARHSAAVLVPPGWWHYGRFADGTPVPLAARRFYASRWDLRAAFEDPWSTGDGTYLAWLRAHEPALLDATPAATAAP